ncbi:N-methyl-L-tryptophan oxidase [Streptomyces canus]|uniref:N-methyl-L-tryptophan oxidase n=1 Tax=Streptomyces canus TaxID=58343 RepID=UPI0030E40853
MVKNDFQTVVVGGGAIGSATAYWLAVRGQTDVLVLEQHTTGHGLGSSGDHSRIIRHSYHDTIYGRLTRRMYDNWASLERESKQGVFLKTGGLDIAIEGTPGADIIDNYRRVMASNEIPFDTLDKKQLGERFPQWNIVEDEVRATYQEDSGLIDIRRATLTHLALAESLGVIVKDNTTVQVIESFHGGVRIVTGDDTYTADKVVVAVGSWVDQLLKPLGQTWNTTIAEEQVVYVQTPHVKDFSVGTFPVWGWHGDDLFYGFPTYGEVAIKIARENLRRFVTQETRSPEPHEDETAVVLEFLKERLPTGVGPVLYAKTCPYDLPPDRHFILDFLPGHPRVVVGNGAAHAGKFAGLLGEILSELAVTGRSSFPIEPFRADRPALKDPDFVPVFTLKG